MSAVLERYLEPEKVFLEKLNQFSSKLLLFVNSITIFPAFLNGITHNLMTTSQKQQINWGLKPCFKRREIVSPRICDIEQKTLRNPLVLAPMPFTAITFLRHLGKNQGWKASEFSRRHGFCLSKQCEKSEFSSW